MIGYASRTGTRRNLDALRAAGWSLLISARGVLRSEGFSYALDNGAWTSFQEWQKGTRPTSDPDLTAFVRAVDRVGRDAEWIVVPDVVQGGERSWVLTRAWLRRLRRDPRLKSAKLLIAVQDGMSVEVVAPYLNARVGLFVGGSDTWKEASMHRWAACARQRNAYIHVARVNTARRIALCGRAKVDSFDGSSASRYAQTLPMMEDARRRATVWCRQLEIWDY